MSDTGSAPSVCALRRLCRSASSAALSTIATAHKQVDDGWPATSMVVPAIDIDGTPIILISDLADHTRHLQQDNRVSLLFTAPDPGGARRSPGDANAPIETDNARITVFGRAEPDNDSTTRVCYLRANPNAALYADFADFGFYRIVTTAIYWVGGFGKQRRLSGAQFIASDCHALKSSHDDIVTHLNSDHADALHDIVSRYTSSDPMIGWQIYAIDCDGMVLRPGNPDLSSVRIDFPETIHTPGEARDILVEMCKKSRK